ncbi:MAG: hypothetical protein ACYC6O_04355 [Thermoleophilia bacterium]
MLDNREIAFIAWLLVGLLAILLIKDVRSSLFSAFHILVTPIILVPLGIMVCWVGSEVFLASKYSLWQIDLIKDTLIWFLVSGLVLFFNIVEASKRPYFFRHKILELIGASLFLEFFFNIFVMNIVLEFILFPVIFFLVILAAVAGNKSKFASIKIFSDVILSFIVLLMIAFTIKELFSNWNHLDKVLLFKQLILPIWLAMGLLPFIYLMTIYINYERAFKWIKLETDGRRSRITSKLALITKLSFHTHDLHIFNRVWAKKMVAARSLTGARQILENFRESIRDAERALREEQDRLQRYSGSEGVDEEGRRLDRREFKETKGALIWLHTCHMGWYRREGHYRADLLEKVLFNDFTSQGLPPNPGIIMKVSQDGQSWYAWRKTISNWFFAIGAAGPPPNEWQFDGPEHPAGFPGQDPMWGAIPFSADKSPNWTLKS